MEYHKKFLLCEYLQYKQYLVAVCTTVRSTHIWPKSSQSVSQQCGQLVRLSELQMSAWVHEWIKPNALYEYFQFSLQLLLLIRPMHSVQKKTGNLIAKFFFVSLVYLKISLALGICARSMRWVHCPLTAEPSFSSHLATFIEDSPKSRTRSSGPVL